MSIHKLESPGRKRRNYDRSAGKKSSGTSGIVFPGGGGASDASQGLRLGNSKGGGWETGYPIRQKEAKLLHTSTKKLQIRHVPGDHPTSFDKA